MGRLLQALVLSLSLVVVHQASALDVGAQVGLRVNKSTVPGTSSKDKVGFQGGLLAVSPIVPMIGFRTGALLVQRDAQIEFADATANRLFLDIPLTLEASLGVASLYAGADFGLKLSSSCSNCTLREEKSAVFQPVVGVDFHFFPTLAIGGFYEFETEYHENWKQSAFGVNGSFRF